MRWMIPCAQAAVVAVLAATPAVAECDLKIADLTARMEQRRADTLAWERELAAISTKTSAVFESIIDRISTGETCTEAMRTDLADKIGTLGQIQNGTSVPRDSGLDAETDNTFTCVSEISGRLEIARAAAVSEGDAIRLLRYNNVADTLATLDQGYTGALVDAKAAQLRGKRIAEMLDRLTSLCSESDF